eukprot:scaffold3941_cov412-Prasinococcus_capsulatus_cf.AAC.18
MPFSLCHLTGSSPAKWNWPLSSASECESLLTHMHKAGGDDQATRDSLLVLPTKHGDDTPSPVLRVLVCDLWPPDAEIA